jgi:hypothetical protein
MSVELFGWRIYRKGFTKVFAPGVQTLYLALQAGRGVHESSETFHEEEAEMRKHECIESPPLTIRYYLYLMHVFTVV